MIEGIDHQKLRTCVERLVGAQDAEDVTQATYLKLLRYPHDASKSQLMTWAYTLARTEAHSFLRRRRVQAEGAEVPEQSVDERPVRTTRIYVTQVLEKLSDADRRVFEVYVEQGTAQKAADALGVTLNVFRRRLAEARAAAREVA